jgi:hypothetical protein
MLGAALFFGQGHGTAYWPFANLEGEGAKNEPERGGKDYAGN